MIKIENRYCKMLTLFEIAGMKVFFTACSRISEFGFIFHHFWEIKQSAVLSIVLISKSFVASLKNGSGDMV